MMTKQQVQLIELEPLMIDAKTACRICGNISARTWATWISTGQAPQSYRNNPAMSIQKRRNRKTTCLQHSIKPTLTYC